MATSQLPPTIGAATSQYKIQCNSSTIYIGDQEFLSATDALELYLSQYDNTAGLHGNQAYKRTVNDLLNPKSALHMTAERSLETGVRATEKELKLADAKDSINDSLLQMKKTVSLQAQVEEALNKSKDLMEKIHSDEPPETTDVPSEVGSLSTDILVSLDPAQGLAGVPPAWKSRHVYGYKRPRARRHKTMSSLQISHDMMGLTEEKPSHSFTGQPADKSLHVTFNDGAGDKSVSSQKMTSVDDDVSMLLGDSPNTSRTSRSPAKKSHERCRSVSPSILRRERKLFESGLRDKPIPDFYTDFTIPPKPPSWIDTLNLSDVSDSDWKKRDFTTSRPPPSWVQDMDNSDITSVVSTAKPSKPLKKLELHDLLQPLPVINTQDSSYSDANDTLPPPGLTYKDLIGDTSRLKNKNTQNKDGGDQASPTLSDKILDLKTKTNAALSKYHERVLADTPSKGSNPYSDNMPRCSSMDTAALVAGIPPLGNTASPIVAGPSPTKSPHRARTPDTDIILEGDRPWEKTTPFRPPVTIQDSSKDTSDEGPNYSGGAQPGSLEALKNMIFKLQQEAVHTDSEDEGSRSKISERVHKLRAEAANLGIPVPGAMENDSGRGSNNKKAPGDIPALKGYDFKGEPGGQSLEKALTHLDRLKSLVNDQQASKGQQGSGSGPKPLCADMQH